MWKWFKWVLLAIAIFLFCVLINFIYHYFVAIKFSPELRQRAENALARGIAITDIQNDFVLMGQKDPGDGGKPNNVNPYPLGFNDIKSLQVGADEEYLYYKVTFWGEFPRKVPIINGDTIESTGSKLEFMDEKGMDLQVMHLNSGWTPKIGFSAIDTQYAYGATGIVWPENARMTHEERDSFVDGGSGTNYLMGAFPLKKMGLQFGQQVTLACQVETESDKYDHAAVDVLRGLGKGLKEPGYFIWKIGANEYQTDESFRNQGYN